MSMIPKCKVCECTENDPCFNPKYGFSGFKHDDTNICTFCTDEIIKNDPLTVRRIKSTAKKAGVDVQDIIKQLEEGKPFVLPKKSRSGNGNYPQNRVGVKKAPRKNTELEQNMLALGNALTDVRVNVLNLSAHQAKLRCDMPNDTVYNVERGASEIRNLLKYCKGLDLGLSISYENGELCVKIYRNGEQIFP